jgi:P27 family predicted phage terminase small subunit
MSKKEIKPGSPEGVGIAWVDIEIKPTKPKAAKKKPDGVPKYLGEDGAEVFLKWKSILQESGNWKDEHIEIVGLTAKQYELYILASGKIDIESAVIEHKNGTTGQNPWVNVQQAAFKNVLTFSNRFGLNPLFQNKVPVNKQDDDSEI